MEDGHDQTLLTITSLVRSVLNSHDGRTAVAHQPVGLRHGHFWIGHLALTAASPELVRAFDHLPDRLRRKRLAVRRKSTAGVDGKFAVDFGLAVPQDLVRFARFAETAGFQGDQVVLGAVVRQFKYIDIFRADTRFLVGLLGGRVAFAEHGRFRHSGAGERGDPDGRVPIDRAAHIGGVDMGAGVHHGINFASPNL